LPGMKSHARDLLIVRENGHIKASGLPLYYRAVVYKLLKRQQMGNSR